MNTIESMCEAANLHLRRSIGTSAGKHQASLRKMAAAMRAGNERGELQAAARSAEAAAMSAAAARRSGWPFHVEQRA
jgi:hypothetical protein